jgi:membrane-associated phospholipid phosphatase
MAITAGFSRIYLGQHFLTDVLAGAFLGSVISICALLVSNAIAPRKPIQLFKKQSFQK